MSEACENAQPEDLKLGKVPCLFISCNITVSWFYPLNGFQINLLFDNSGNNNKKLSTLDLCVSTCFPNLIKLLLIKKLHFSAEAMSSIIAIGLYISIIYSQ